MGSPNTGASEVRVMNVNVGILGHIDSGKTSLGEKLCSRDHKLARRFLILSLIRLSSAFFCRICIEAVWAIQCPLGR